MQRIKFTPAIDYAFDRVPREVREKRIVLEKPPKNLKATHKIELFLGKRRSSLAHKYNDGVVTIWESGRRLHGGGDEKMYWCGYDVCGMPFSTDNFGFMHVVCPKCQKELFLDPGSKQLHIDQQRKEGKDASARQLAALPMVVGEKFFKLSIWKLVDLLEKTFNQLNRDADIYLKFAPADLRFDKNHMNFRDIEQVQTARVERKPVIYPLGRLVKDLTAGAEIRVLLHAFLTS